ncbi:hypothetical protein [Sphingobacterium siyangense]|uniref:hypothetical protein n=1 Tax=Sphingobacterium siyangense TaxID=459529 RepID=UPI003DA3F4F6
MDSYENRAIRMLLQPSIHLYYILDFYNNDNKNIILNCLANEQISDLIEFLNGLIDNIEEEKKEDNIVELLTLQLHIRCFVSELRESYINIVDLLYHKEDNNVISILEIVNKELTRNNIEVPDSVLVDIRSKVQQGVREALTNTNNIVKNNSKKLTPRQFMEAERLKKSLQNKRDN